MESVRAGETGAYYDRDDPEALARAVETFDPLAVDPQACVDAAQRFGSARFQAQLRTIVARAVEAERAPRPGRSPYRRDRPAVKARGLGLTRRNAGILTPA